MGLTNDAENIKIERFRPERAETVSNIIRRCLIEINSRDYSAEEIAQMTAEFSPELMLARGADKTLDFFTAQIGDETVGTVAANECTDMENTLWLMTLFVNPDFHGRGIGKALVARVEALAAEKGRRAVSLCSSITSHRFYKKLGYEYVSGNDMPDEYGHIRMIKLVKNIE